MVGIELYSWCCCCCIMGWPCSGPWAAAGAWPPLPYPGCGGGCRWGAGGGIYLTPGGCPYICCGAGLMEDNRRFFSSHECLWGKDFREKPFFLVSSPNRIWKKEWKISGSQRCLHVQQQHDRQTHTLKTYLLLKIYESLRMTLKTLNRFEFPIFLTPPDSNEHRNNQPLTLLFLFCFTNFKEMAKEKTKPNRFRVSSRTLLLTMADSMQQMLYQAGPWNR